jgi:hypothetical protein
MGLRWKVHEHPGVRQRCPDISIRAMHSHLPLTPSVLSVHAFFFSVLDLFIVPVGLLYTTVRVNAKILHKITGIRSNILDKNRFITD